MQAIRCRPPTTPEELTLDDVPAPAVGPGEVGIEVHACAVGFPDSLMVQDRYQFKPPPPFSPGGEVAGIVTAVGDGVSGFAAGDRVLAWPGVGGLAEQVTVRVEQCAALPADADLVVAASFLTAYGTSHYALHDRAHLRVGESLLVLGASGGVGLAAVELGVLAGARVIAAASSELKLELCRRYGASATINYETEDLKERVRALTDGHGADVVYDAVGGHYAEPALRAIAWDGRFLVVGFAAGVIPKIPLNLALLKSCSIVGVFWGAFVGRDRAAASRHIDELMSLLRSGTLRPHVSATYPLAEAGAAIRALTDRRVTGRVVITTDALRARVAH